MEHSTSYIRILYVAFTATSSFAVSFIMTTYSPYLEAQGLNPLERNAVNAFFFTTCLLAEGPTGAIADVLGQRKAFTWSSIVFGSGFLLYSRAHSFTACVIAEVISAVGRTLANGALDGWMSNHFSKLSNGAELRRDTIRIEYIARCGMSMLGGFVGSVIAGGNANSKLPWITGGVITICNGVAVWCILPTSPISRKAQRLHWRIIVIRLTRMFTKSITVMKQSSALRYNFVVSFTFACSVQALNMQWPQYYRPSWGVSSRLGMLGSLISLSMAIGSIVSRQWKHDAHTISKLQLVIGVCMCLCAITQNPLSSVCLFLAHELFRGAFQTVQSDYVQQHAPNRKRSTIKSISSMPHHLGGIIGLLVSGKVALLIGIQWSWLLSGLFLFCLTLATWKLKPRD